MHKFQQMGRGRLSMELIQKEKARKTTFVKRKNGLMKKVDEFSTLCGVDVCLIIYGPNFDGQRPTKPETWPQDTDQVRRIIQKYHNTTSDRPPRIYDVEKYYRDRVKKVEGEISKVHKEKEKPKPKITYPTWDTSFNDLREDQLIMFAGILDSKIVSCNQRINMLKQDPKGKAIMVESKDNVDENVFATLYLASSNPSSYLNFMPNKSQQAQFIPHLPMKPIIDYTTQLPFYPSQLGGSSSQSSTLHFDQNTMQLMGKNGTLDWEQPVGTFSTHDIQVHFLNYTGDGSNNQNSSSPCYYKGNIQSVQPYSFALPQYEDVPPEFQVNGLYDTNVTLSSNVQLHA
ncbi:hypothetical protein AAHE18_15G165200 [Arachis hypogaea]